MKEWKILEKFPDIDISEHEHWKKGSKGKDDSLDEEDKESDMGQEKKT